MSAPEITTGKGGLRAIDGGRKVSTACRCDPPGLATYVDEDDGTRRCFACAKRRVSE